MKEKQYEVRAEIKEREPKERHGSPWCQQTERRTQQFQREKLEQGRKKKHQQEKVGKMWGKFEKTK